MKATNINLGFESLLDAIEYAKAEGYRTEFTVDEFGFIDDSKLFYYPKDIVKLKSIRMDAPFSDPDEESILYMIKMKNGKQGWVSDTYGAYANTDLAAHLKYHVK